MEYSNCQKKPKKQKFSSLEKGKKEPYQKPQILMDEELNLSLYKPCDSSPLAPS